MSTGPNAPPPEADLARPSDEPVQIGILTEGKATLAMVIVGLVLQESVPLDIYIVDTAESAVIKRDDVVFAMRLASDRGVYCGYEHIRERNRRFSVGRLRLLDELTGTLISFMDDDIVLAPSATHNLYERARKSDTFGFLSPVCKNWGDADSPLPGRPHYSPGGIIYQDPLVRRVLRSTTATRRTSWTRGAARIGSGRRRSSQSCSRRWARLSEVRQDCLSYHLDYRERPVRYRIDDGIVQASVSHARALAAAALQGA